MEAATIHPHIVRNPEILSGEPIIKGTRTPVRAIVEYWRMAISPEEIAIKLPHLSMAQIFDALSFFSENTQEILAYIERNKIAEHLIHPAVRNL